MLLSSGIQADGQEADWFVAPGGNDRWSGKLAAPNADGSDGPLATLNAARIKVREKLSSGSKSPINVLIRGGEYALDETIEDQVVELKIEKGQKLELNGPLNK
jgi:hypothetical protein